MDPWMQVVPAKKTRRNCTETYLRGLRNQNVEHVNQCESNILKTQSHSLVNLPELYFLLKVKITKMKIIHHRQSYEGCIHLGRIRISYRTVQSIIWPIFSEILIFCWNNSKIWETKKILTIFCEINVR